jgi:hypothetical protein
VLRERARRQEELSLSISLSATLGGELACFILGVAFVKGWYGLPKSSRLACVWFSRMSKCAHQSASEQAREEANEWLARIRPSRGSAPAGGTPPPSGGSFNDSDWPSASFMQYVGRRPPSSGEQERGGTLPGVLAAARAGAAPEPASEDLEFTCF